MGDDEKRFNALHEYWAAAHGLRGDPRMIQRPSLVMAKMQGEARRKLADFWDEQNEKSKRTKDQTASLG